jgi:hypothetical protein
MPSRTVAPMPSAPAAAPGRGSGTPVELTKAAPAPDRDVAPMLVTPPPPSPLGAPPPADRPRGARRAEPVDDDSERRRPRVALLALAGVAALAVLAGGGAVLAHAVHHPDHQKPAEQAAATVPETPSVTGSCHQLACRFQVTQAPSGQGYAWFVDGKAVSGSGSTLSQTFDAPGAHTVEVRAVSGDVQSKDASFKVTADPWRRSVEATAAGTHVRGAQRAQSAACGPATVVLQRRTDHAWKGVSQQRASGQHSRFSFAVPATGTYRVAVAKTTACTDATSAGVHVSLPVNSTPPPVSPPPVTSSTPPSSPPPSSPPPSSPPPPHKSHGPKLPG